VSQIKNRDTNKLKQKEEIVDQPLPAMESEARAGSP